MYLDSKLVTATMHGCNYSLVNQTPIPQHWVYCITSNGAGDAILVMQYTQCWGIGVWSTRLAVTITYMAVRELHPTVVVPIQPTNNYSELDNDLQRDPSCFQGNYQLVHTFMLASNKSVG